MNSIFTTTCHALRLIALITATIAAAAHSAPPRIFYLNSYHEGYPPSDEAMAGLRDTLRSQAEIEMFFLDGKRQSDAAALRSRIEQALAAIRAFKPDVLVVSDDDAVKHIVAPHFKEGPFPVVFCGVNWSCAQYDLPTPNVTGMLEVVPVIDALQILQRHFPKGTRLAVVSEDSTSERSNRTQLDTSFRALQLTPQYYLVKDFAAWKEAFVAASQDADFIYLPTNGAIIGWNDAEARAWVRHEIKKPVFTCDDFMMPYCVLGLAKVAREQGEWAACTALAIARGKSPAEIPVTRNQQTRAWFNETLAERIGFSPEPALRARCTVVQ